MNDANLATIEQSAAALGESTTARRSRTKTAKVLHVINGEHYSGAERVQDLLALRLGEFGYEVGFACVKPDKFLRSRQAQEAAIHETPMAHKLDVRVAQMLVKLVRQHRYQLIHAHTPRTAMVGRIAAAWAGVPLVYHVHSPTSRDSTRGFANRVNTWIERSSASGAAKLICVSQSLGRHMLAERFPASRIAVVPNGVPTVDAVLPRPTPTGEWTIGTVALFRQRKGTEVLIDALAMLREQELPARLRCVGGFETAEYERQLKERVAQYSLESFVDWTGFTRDVNAELNRMDLFALPSLFGEGLPMVVLEAMATGVPVVATDVEGVPEAIRDGVDGVIARPRDADDLAQQIARVIRGELDWQRLRSSALDRQRTTFSDESMAAGVANVYDELLQQSTLGLCYDGRMANRNSRVAIAQETVEIIRRGWYDAPSGQRVDIADDQRRAEAATRLYRPDDFAEIFRQRDELLSARAPTNARFHVVNCTTFAAARDLIEADSNVVPFCLNFASAKHPGGGFLGGSQAQEECLARASGLYGTLLRHPEMYDANHRFRSSLYTDHMIYSPGVPVFRDDDDVLLAEPYRVTLLTSPSVNLGAVQANEPQNVGRVASIMLARIEQLLSVAVVHGDRQLVLGAWGCGVFRNDPAHVAQWFHHWLVERPMFRGAFDVVAFAVLDWSDDLATFRPFQQQFAA